MPIVLRGMNGLGDCIHQRAVVRQLMQRDVFYLKTPWPCIYHDLVGERLKLLAPQTSLRTQVKNAKREADKFERASVKNGHGMSVSYSPSSVRSHGSVLAAMLASVGCSIREADFSLPIPQVWHDKAAAWRARWSLQKPLLLYRPLVERTEWGGCATRNPDHGAYAELLRSIRDLFVIASIADVEPGREWIVGHDIHADIECHAGELDIETVAALTASAALVFCSPGFMVPLAQSVGTPVVCVFGGYENSSSFSAGAHMAPYLGIDPIHPCECFSHTHACRKDIDMTSALERLRVFAGEAIA